MNLHAIASAAISGVNPPVAANLYPSTGYSTGADGKRTPTYGAAQPLSAQVQALTWKDLQQLDGVNIEGDARGVYLNGDWKAVVRPLNKGGDLLTLADGSNWLVAQVLEDWAMTAGWVKVCAVRQL